MASSAILILAVIGLALSLYAYYLEYKLQDNSNYAAACDLNDRMSCTKVIKSPYSKTFGISNSILGLGYYSAIIGLVLTHQLHLLGYLVIGGLVASGYLAYILYFKIKTICVVCTSIYIVNILLFLFVISHS